MINLSEYYRSTVRIASIEDTHFLRFLTPLYRFTIHQFACYTPTHAEFNEKKRFPFNIAMALSIFIIIRCDPDSYTNRYLQQATRFLPSRDDHRWRPRKRPRPPGGCSTVIGGL